ncbi:hypothetical protein BS17DRAFT_754186 [Gyrodon lividus]|nr:hypothetical protein BS17DRAFT_754186 [Gyrodon lividus]
MWPQIPRNCPHPPRTFTDKTQLFFPRRIIFPPFKPTPLPKFQIIIVLFVCLIEPIASQCILPFVNEELVADLDITEGDKRKVGMQITTQLSTRPLFVKALTTLQWSRLADYVGRNLVFLMGFFGLCRSVPHILNLSDVVTYSCSSRCTTGVPNGNVGVMKSMMGELTHETNQAHGLAFHPVGRQGWHWGMWSSQLIFMCTPLFSGTFWAEYPCSVIAMFAAFRFVMVLAFLNEIIYWLQTLPSTTFHKPQAPTVDRETNSLSGRYGAIENAHLESLESPVQRSWCSFFILYSTPIELGGSGFSPATIGFWMSGLGIGNGVFQAFSFACKSCIFCRTKRPWRIRSLSCSDPHDFGHHDAGGNASS